MTRRGANRRRIEASGSESKPRIGNKERGVALPACAVTSHCSRHGAISGTKPRHFRLSAQGGLAQDAASHGPEGFSIRVERNPTNVEHRRQRQDKSYRVEPESGTTISHFLRIRPQLQPYMRPTITIPTADPGRACFPLARAAAAPDVPRRPAPCHRFSSSATARWRCSGQP